MLEERAVDVFQRVNADYCIDLSIDITRHERDYPALHADVELRGLGAEDILRDARRMDNRSDKPAGRARSPHAPVFHAEGTGASARWDLGWRGFPQQPERNVSAVAASTDEHGCLLCACYDA